jgi:hypothetical protein
MLLRCIAYFDFAAWEETKSLMLDETYVQDDTTQTGVRVAEPSGEYIVPNKITGPARFLLIAALLLYGLFVGHTIGPEWGRVGVQLYCWPILGFSLLIIFLDYMRFVFVRDLLILFLLWSGGFLMGVRTNPAVALSMPALPRIWGDKIVMFFCILYVLSLTSILLGERSEKRVW